jgi:hypothetical protein
MSTAPEQPDRAAFAPPLLLELFSPEARADPYPLYRRYREEQPVCRGEMGFWTFTRYEDVLRILREPRFSSDPRNATAIQQFLPQDTDTPSPIRDGAGRVLLFTDPPDHTRMRTLVNKAFTARRVESLRPRIQELVDGLLEPVRERGEMDVIADLAYPLPAVVICELMGVPTEDHDRFREWSRDVAPVLDPINPPEVDARAIEALGHFGDYFTELIAKRRAEPRDDLLTALIAAETDEGKLDQEELLSICGLVFIAGHETTQNLIGNGLLALLRNPDQLRILREDRGHIRNAIEELLRYDSPVQLTARSALDDVEVGDHTVPKGEEVVVFLGSANRDPAMFADPDRLDVRREHIQVASFGAGVHFCLGAPLARVEGQITFATLLDRFADIALATDEPEWRGTLTLRGLRSLPVRVGNA